MMNKVQRFNEYKISFIDNTSHSYDLQHCGGMRRMDTRCVTLSAVGRAIAQAGFPPRRPGFEPRSDRVGFAVDKVALGQVFSEYFGFSCQLSFNRLLHLHHLSSGAGTIGQLVADVPSGLSLTPPQETKKLKKLL
jgi:hypothetical protein